MSAVGRALVRAVPLMADRRVLALVLAPLAAAMMLWLFVAIAFWAPLRDALAAVIAIGLAALGFMAVPGWISAAGGNIAAFVFLTLAVGALLLAAIAVFAAPVFVRAVEARHFPLLERKHGGTMAGGLANALITITLWLPMWLVVFPLLFVPVIGVPLSLLQSAWFNQRLFRYDALAEHASALERAAILRAARGRLLTLGLVVAPLSFVPVVNLLSPLYAGLAFTCLCLDELAALRATAAKA